MSGFSNLLRNFGTISEPYAAAANQLKQEELERKKRAEAWNRAVQRAREAQKRAQQEQERAQQERDRIAQARAKRKKEFNDAFIKARNAGNMYFKFSDGKVYNTSLSKDDQDWLKLNDNSSEFNMNANPFKVVNVKTTAGQTGQPHLPESEDGIIKVEDINPVDTQSENGNYAFNYLRSER